MPDGYDYDVIVGPAARNFREGGRVDWLRHGNRRGGNSRQLQTPPSLLLTTPAEPPGPPLAKPGFAPGGVAGEQFVGAGRAPGAGLVRLDRRWRVQ